MIIGLLLGFAVLSIKTALADGGVVVAGSVGVVTSGAVVFRQPFLEFNSQGQTEPTG